MSLTQTIILKWRPVSRHSLRNNPLFIFFLNIKPCEYIRHKYNDQLLEKSHQPYSNEFGVSVTPRSILDYVFKRNGFTISEVPKSNNALQFLLLKDGVDPIEVYS